MPSDALGHEGRGSFEPMKQILIFDTETTGKEDFKAAPDDPHQPRIVTLAAMLCRDDSTVIAQIDLTIKPEGFEIPADATAIHGISTEKALTVGVDCYDALRVFVQLANLADVLVAYNADNDKLVITGEYLRCFQEPPWKDWHEWADPMHLSTPLCKLPGRYDGAFKWPKLSEAYQHFFKRPLADAHSALGDVRATAEIYFYLKSIGAV